MLFGSGNALWVTKLRIDSVHVLTEKIPPGGRGTPLHLPYRYWSEIGPGFGEPDDTLPPPHAPRIPRNTFPGRNSKVFYKLGPP